MPEKLTRILYVEDELDIQMVARIALESLGGFTLQICSSGDEALLSAPLFLPQLVLLDVMMPGMDGPTTLRKLREMPQCADTPMLFMTAKVQPGEVAAYKAIGALDVIAKPFDPMTLAAQIQAVWDGQHG